jgi:excisionase family DNA binding protein
MQRQDIPTVVKIAAASMLAAYVPGLTGDKLESLIQFQQEEIPDRLRSRIEAAKALNVSLPTVDRMLQAGELPCRRIRGRVFVPQSAIRNLIEGK